METTIHHLEVDDLVTWTHRGVDYVARIDSISFGRNSFNNSDHWFLRDADYDGRTVFTVHDRKNDA